MNETTSARVGGWLAIAAGIGGAVIAIWLCSHQRTCP